MGAPDDIRASDTTRFSWLLAALVAMLGLPPLLSTVTADVPRFRIVSSIVLVAALFAVSRTRGVRVAGVALVVPALLTDWLTYLSPTRELAMLQFALSCGALGVVTGAIGAALVRYQRVTADTILGGVCVYLLLGLIWSLLFSLLEIASPGSILQGGVPVSELAPSGEPYRFPALLYFSFVTLTTLGYGDFLPNTDATRALASAEAVVGQLYVAVFVARLVGLHLTQTRGEERT